ncbi:hypothetical protein PENSTE_c002G07151 [Penicillium steckii]|uniref:Uncharacterized protein n=1 Tax=Penicillium steckii TaxID=303698 RepID=A0A1V6TTT1_9EURO|nr:hypothetical protein PENSTE_c002G07151 [Penicillium steckii]
MSIHWKSIKQRVSSFWESQRVSMAAKADRWDEYDDS